MRASYKAMVFQVFFLLLAANLSVSNLYARSGTVDRIVDEQDLDRSSLSSKSRYVEKGLSKETEEEDKEKANQLVKILRSKMPKAKISRSGVTNIVKVSRYLIKRHRRVFHSCNAVFVKASKEFSHLAFQVYEDETVYIHFGEQDPRRGAGGFKVFYRVLRLSDGKLFANVNLNVSSGRARRKLRQEVTLMRHLRNKEHTLGYEHFSLYKGTFGGENEVIASIQMKLFDSDLSDFMSTKPDMKTLLKIMIYATEGLNNFHSVGYVHRDIKKSNFFLTLLSDDEVDLTVADYGLAKRFSQNRASVRVAGTKGYIDPYLCHLQNSGSEKQIDREDQVSSDVFSLGMAFYTVLFKDKKLRSINQDFNDSTMHDNVSEVYSYEDYIGYYRVRLKNLAKEETSDDKIVPLSVREIVFSMISPYPDDRPSLEEVQGALESLEEEVGAQL